jgi:alpha-tubulin suppressor-like RCC1 family protein
MMAKLGAGVTTIAVNSGDGSLNSSPGATPVVIDNSSTYLTNVSTISVGTNASCALKGDRTVWCWGDNSEGQLGDSTFPAIDNSKVAIQVKKSDTTPLTNVIAISVGTDHACAVISDGSAWCWGDNSDGATGTGTTAANLGAVRVTKAANAALTGVTAISAGASHTCALLSDKTVWCWGQFLWPT